MPISNKIYPRTGDTQTVYLKNVITNPNIKIGDYTMYNDFVNDPKGFEQNNVLYHYPINHDKLIIGKFCSIACVLIIEPGLGYRLEKAQYSLITNYSILSPEITKPYIVSGDDRFERADELLKHCNDSFSVAEAFQILKSVKQEGIWATRVSFVYSVNENRVYYVENNDFEYVTKYQFCNSY